MVIFWVAAFAALWHTVQYLQCSGISPCGVSDAAEVVLLDSDSILPCYTVCRDMICRCGSDDEDDDEKQWDVFRKTITKISGMF
jgi:hypothetical protein